jgi:hypothetical protein
MSTQLRQGILELFLPGRKSEIAVDEKEHDKHYSHEDMRGLEEFIESIPEICQRLSLLTVRNSISPNKRERHES